MDAFELWCWKRLLRVPWTARRSNQSILKEISSEYSMQRLMLKLKLQYFGHLMWRTDSFEKTPMLVKNEGRRRMGWHRMRWTWVLSKRLEFMMDREAWGATVHGGHKESDMTEWLNWTTYLMRNRWSQYAGQEATARTRHGTMDWIKTGKGVCQGYISPPCLFNFYVQYIIQNVRLDEPQVGIKIAGRNISNLRYADDTTI